MIEIGSIVSRLSHDCDICFKVIDIKGNIAYLSGVNERLCADAPLFDLVLSKKNDNFKPEIPEIINNREEYFYLPGKILHIDGDNNYLNKSLKFYKDSGVFAIGKTMNESDIPKNVGLMLREIKPDILVITGHDAYYNKTDSYKNSNYFMEAVKVAREYEKDHEKLIIIAGACQSFYEGLIKSGANYASSPKRINIHALDPAIIAVNISLLKKDENVDIINLLNKTKYGKNGIGGIMGKGTMYVGYPR